MQTWVLYANHFKMEVKMAAEKFDLTTFVILLIVFCLFKKLMTNILIILTNQSVTKDPKITVSLAAKN